MSLDEATALLHGSVPDITDQQISEAFDSSGGSPLVLQILASYWTSGRPPGGLTLGAMLESSLAGVSWLAGSRLVSVLVSGGVEGGLVYDLSPWRPLMKVEYVDQVVLVWGGVGEHPAGFGTPTGGGVDQDGFRDAGQGVDHGAD